jgi:hypothetical protein
MFFRQSSDAVEASVSRLRRSNNVGEDMVALPSRFRDTEDQPQGRETPLEIND